MEPRPEPPPWLPVTRTPPAPPAVPPAADAAGAPPPGARAGAGAPRSGALRRAEGSTEGAPPPSRPSFTWQRLTRTRRGAAGLAIGSAALLLWPFAGWSAIPWLV